MQNPAITPSRSWNSNTVCSCALSASGRRLLCLGTALARTRLNISSILRADIKFVEGLRSGRACSEGNFGNGAVKTLFPNRPIGAVYPPHQGQQGRRDEHREGGACAMAPGHSLVLHAHWLSPYRIVSSDAEASCVRPPDPEGARPAVVVLSQCERPAAPSSDPVRDLRGGISRLPAKRGSPVRCSAFPQTETCLYLRRRRRRLAASCPANLPF